MQQLMYQGQVISYVVTKKRRKTLSISIGKNQQVTVSAPLRMTDADIRRMVESKAGWIVQKLEEWKGRALAGMDRVYGEGGVFLYRGAQISLALRSGLQKEIELQQEKLLVSLPVGIRQEESGLYLKAELRRWYIRQAARWLEEAVERYGAVLGRFPTRVLIKEQKTRWGSCTARDVINFNWKLVMAPPQVLEYVVVHELCHMEIRNHSAAFWDRVGSILPDYREQRKWLKENGWKLTL